MRHESVGFAGKQFSERWPLASHKADDCHGMAKSRQLAQELVINRCS